MKCTMNGGKARRRTSGGKKACTRKLKSNAQPQIKCPSCRSKHMEAVYDQKGIVFTTIFTCYRCLHVWEINEIGQRTILEKSK
jgi:DNA-directed RNA polymerase subunit M/transcription elongation factor TFIIS